MAIGITTRACTTIYKPAGADAKRYCWFRVSKELESFAKESERRQTTPPQSGGKPSNYQTTLAIAGGTTKIFTGAGACDNLGGGGRVPGAGTRETTDGQPVAGSGTCMAAAGKSRPQESKELHDDSRRKWRDQNVTLPSTPSSTWRSRRRQTKKRFKITITLARNSARKPSCPIAVEIPICVYLADGTCQLRAHRKYRKVQAVSWSTSTTPGAGLGLLQVPVQTRMAA